MSVSTAIADVQARGTGADASGNQRECLLSRLVPLALRLAPIRFRNEPS